MITHDVELLHDARAELAEGPVWLPDRNVVAWVDILRGSIWMTDLEGSTSLAYRLDRPVGSIAVADDGALVAATPFGLEHLSPSPVRLATLPHDTSVLRMNDGKCDPVGRFVGGTMGWPEPVPRAGSLWSFEAGSVRRLLSDVTISNGLCWSADGATMFYIDTPTQQIDAFDYDLSTGDLFDRRSVVRVDAELGAPDGMTIDEEGGLWVALWGGGAVHRYDNGELSHRVEVPTPYVTCPTFAGSDLDRLVVTTAARPFTSEPPRGAGALFVASAGVRGQPSSQYRLHR